MNATAGTEEHVQGPQRLWHVRELRFAAVAAVLAGWLTGRTRAEVPRTVLELAAVAVGASTLVPAAVRNLHGTHPGRCRQTMPAAPRRIGRRVRDTGREGGGDAARERARGGKRSAPQPRTDPTGSWPPHDST
ncbi:hypothetical protein ACWD3J_39360 [Streptomyces sp. NPDC002755]